MATWPRTLNLAEGLPVIDQPFRVKHGVAVLDSQPAVQLKNGGLEEAKGDKFAGFSFQDDPGVTTFADSLAPPSGTRRLPSRAGRGRAGPDLAKRPPVPDRQAAASNGYSLSCWVKTRELTPAGSFQLLALGTGPKGRQLTFHEGGVGTKPGLEVCRSCL